VGVAVVKITELFTFPGINRTMNRVLYIFALVLLLLGCAFNICAQDRTEIMKQLLSVPAPTPPDSEIIQKGKARPQKFYDKDNFPPDDAPIDDLLDYWRGRPSYKDGPSMTVLQRLLDASVDDLEKLASLLQLFPTSDTFAEKIKRAYDKEETNPKLQYQRRDIKKWLLYNSKYYVEELLALANKVKEDNQSGSIDNVTALLTLAKVDWSRAEPLLQNLTNGGPQRTSTLALTLLYRHSIDEKDTNAEIKFRNQLQAIASNRNFPGRARDDAIEVLSKTEWSGREEWYLSLFSDESLIHLFDGNYAYSPLSTVFWQEPDKWIPVMTRLVAGKDRVTQQAAASCLARYATAAPRREAILPILRWLSEPDWIPIGETERAWFVQKMDAVEVPESVPGLIWIVENDESFRHYAARVLAHYKDPRAIPALKKALAESQENERRSLLVEGLVASGGLTETEQVDALEAYAAKMVSVSELSEVERYRLFREDRVPVAVSIGRYLAELKDPPDTLVRAVLVRAASLKRENPTLSKSLLEATHGWQGRQIDLELIKTIATNTAEASAIITALERRASLRESVAPELHSLIAAGGAPQGIGAILLEDSETAGSILISTDPEAQIALLACARLTLTSLPVQTVGPLLKSKNLLLQSAAERYLLLEDSKEARTLLWQHHPNEAFVTGWRENIQLIGGDNFDQIGKSEEKLRAELFKPDGPREIFALFGNGELPVYVLRIYADKAVYTGSEDSSRYQEREVSKAEVASFKQFVSTNRLGDIGPRFKSCHYDCWASEFLMVTKEGGRRFFSHAGFGSTARAIAQNFQVLGRGAKTNYNFEQEIKGSELLFADDSLSVRDVWQRGDEIRIFVERPETDEEKDEAEAPEGNEDANPRAEQWQRELVRTKARFSWRSLKNKDASSVTTTPAGYSTIDVARFPLDENDQSMRRDERQVRVLTQNSILIARNFDGLWKQVAGTKAVRISGDDGAYANPVVTPDGKWVVISKTDSDWSVPNYLVRINLETAQEFRVKLDPADQLDPIAFVPLQNKILLRRAKDDPDEVPVKPNIPEYYLLDPQTGKVQSISGEFAPLHQEGRRFLQPTDNPGEYWSAIPDEPKNQTQVGRYNLKDFSFKPVLVVPKISFDSMSMWVDEKQGKLHLVYRGQLIRLPLKSIAGKQ
jgi:hypothetical protein